MEEKPTEMRTSSEANLTQTAEVFNLCFDAFSQLPIEVQILVQKTFVEYLKTVYATSLEHGDEEKLKPFGLALNVIDAMFSCTGKVHAQGLNEAVIRLKQQSEVLDASGNVVITVETSPPLRGEGAKKMMEAVVGMIQEIETSTHKIVVPRL